MIAGLLAWWIFAAGYGVQPGVWFQGLFLTCYLLEAAALIVSPGPRRGLELLTWRSATALAPAAAALTITWTLTMRLVFGSAFTSSGDAQGNAVAVVALITFAAGTVLFSQLGRYVVVLFAAVFYPYGLFLGRIAGAVRFQPMLPGIAFTIQYLPPVIASCAIVALAYRHRGGRLSNRAGGTRARA